jgi:hypothetical protein
MAGAAASPTARLAADKITERPFIPILLDFRRQQLAPFNDCSLS